MAILQRTSAEVTFWHFVDDDQGLVPVKMAEALTAAMTAGWRGGIQCPGGTLVLEINPPDNPYGTVTCRAGGWLVVDMGTFVYMDDLDETRYQLVVP